MSGPKIVRVVTKEERIELSQRLLARVNEAIFQWKRIGARNGVLDERAIAEMDQRAEALKNLLRRDRFDQIQREAPALVAFLSDDMDARLEAKALADSQAAEGQRRLGQAAKTLLETLGSRSNQMPAALLQTLKHAAEKGERGPAVEGALLKALPYISSKGDGELSPEQRKLVERLRDNRRPGTLADWIVDRNLAAGSPARIARVQEHLTDLAMFSSAQHTRQFSERLSLAGSEENEARQQVLLDSLLIDIAAAKAAAKALQRKRREIGLLCSELSISQSSQCQKLLEAARKLPEDASEAHLDRVVLELREALENVTSARAASARRDAVLRGLAKLGYEVNEGMSTAWADGGKLVLRKPSTPGYGIELGGRADGGRLQMRGVAFDDGRRDATRDADIERLWCSDVSALDDALQIEGGGVKIEKSVKAGETPIKVVAISDIHHAQGAEGSSTSRLSRSR